MSQFIDFREEAIATNFSHMLGEKKKSESSLFFINLNKYLILIT